MIGGARRGGWARRGAAAREPERPLRVQSSCTEAAGPSPAPRGRPEPAARAWRLHGECQVGPGPPPSLPASLPPLRPRPLPPLPQPIPSSRAMHFQLPGFRLPRQGRLGLPAAFNLTLRLGTTSPGAVDQLGVELRSGSRSGEEQEGGKPGLWVLHTDLPRSLLRSLVFLKKTVPG